MVEPKKHTWWNRFTLLERVALIIGLFSTIILGIIIYFAYNFIRSDFATSIVSCVTQQYERASALTLYKSLEPKIGRNLDSKKDFLRPYSYWMAAPPEENYQLLERIGMQVMVENQENVPKSGKVVVISNHRTAFDTAILMHIFNKARDNNLSTCFFADWPEYNLEEAHPNKLFLARRQKLVPGALDKIAEVLDEERVFIIFPSGSLGRQNFHSGALRIALENEAPILPVRIDCNLYWWSEIIRWLNPEMLNSLLVGLSFRHIQENLITVKVGELIPYEELAIKYKNRKIKTPKGERYDPKIMEELRKIVDNIK